ncbi:plasma membrane-associated cation-binding protein 1 [Phalaenopsis equestris]|uniref:plasma membrane-associated cation-binding protein 1 n=1 Tax=Phalaenopsis equestris TaxID=78828 RepID=UPI0009E60348|nr:plasma membrane-associated cation-binding protein 1 [Phalaenopsis equestris]
MGYWKNKVLPKIKKVFEKNGSKKAAAEACKSFDDSKEEINKEFEENKTELQPKVLKIYEASSTEIKILVKERTKAGIKKHSSLVTNFIDELAKIEFPGSKHICEAVSSLGPGNVSAPVVFILEKVSTLVPADETSVAATEKEVAITEEDKKAQESVEKIEGKTVEDEETISTPPPAAEGAAAPA